MDESRPLFPRHDLCRQIDSDAAPIEAEVRRPALDNTFVVPTGERFPIDSGLESSQVVYCGDAQQVSDGFAIALRAMGVEANFLPWGIAPATKTPNREDN
ncbi:MAG: hypothetical protein QOJ84_2421 [Bradyrhizobium sp.]|nr:hypothetical protein [Bradyrhizobium sp.]